MNRWWTLHDDALLAALEAVETGDVTAAEAYAVLCEHSTIHDYASTRGDE